jgi:hypothetical protein
MAFEKVEYKFPDEVESKNIEIESSSAVEIDISGKATKDEYSKNKNSTAYTKDNDADEYDIEVVDDTPKADRGRKASEPPAEITDEELEEYSDKVKTESSILVKATTTKGEQKKRPYVKGKSLKS